MKKVLIVLFMLFFSFSVYAEGTLTVGLWVVVEDETFRTRVQNELTTRLENSVEWSFEVRESDWNTNIHLIVSGMRVYNTNSYAWGITYTPIGFPSYTNGIVAVTEANISGMNWIARSISQYVEEQLFFLMDEITRQNI